MFKKIRLKIWVIFLSCVGLLGFNSPSINKLFSKGLLKSRFKNDFHFDIVQQQKKLNSVTFSDTGKNETLFHHHRFEDFSKGTFSDNGVNLYVSKKGNLKFINLFDLNADGYPEVIINNDHNHYETPDLLIYHNRKPNGLRSLTNPESKDAPAFQNFRWMMESLSSITRLPTEGGGRATVADLNNDGYKELLFTNFIHGSTSQIMPAYIYWGGSDGYNPVRRSLLPSDRASALDVADFNGDGLPDIVVSNLGREHLSVVSPDFSHAALEKRAGERERTSYIFVQTENGFSENAVEVLPTLFAVDVKVADLDKNGRPDLVFLEVGAPGALRVMRRKESKWEMTELLPVIAPTSPGVGKKINREILVKDLNGDGYPDIFAPSDGKRSEIFWNDKGKFNASNRTELESENAFSADAADLNKDGFTDLVVANFCANDKNEKLNYETNSYIWWGSQSGFTVANRTALPTLGATSVRLADVNNTGYTDILFAQHRDWQSYDVPSYIYLNSSNGFSKEKRVELQGFGTVGIVADDLTGNNTKDIILVSSISGKVRHSGIEDGPGNEGVSSEGLPMYIYKGNPNKMYNTANLERAPLSSAETNMAFADMEDKGKADLIHLRGGGYRVSIRYDIDNYPESKELTEITIPFRANSVNVADYNKDGILDILATPINGPQAVLLFGEGNKKYRTDFFDFNHKAYSCAIGDLNNDGLLDAITSSHKEINILFGENAKGNFRFREPKTITTNVLTTRVSLADFNSDGWLDILSENLQRDDTKSYDIESWVLISNKGSFSLSDKKSFHSFGANGATVAQLNGDNKLNVVVSNYHADISRRTPAFILHPDKDGFPSDENKVRLPSFSAGANMVLDFNGDGYQDILVYNHTGADVYNGSLTPTGGMHGIGSVIYWGSKDDYAISNCSHMSSFGPHSRISADPGSWSRRYPYEVYTSEEISNTSNTAFRFIIEGRFNAKQFVEPTIVLSEKKSGTVLLKLISQSSTKLEYDVKIPKGTTFSYQLKMNSSNSGAGPVVSSVKVKKSGK